MAAPSMTFNATGNLLAGGTIAASGTSTFTVDVSTKFEGHIQFSGVFGTVAATAGLQVQVFPIVAGGSTADIVAGAGSFTLLAVASSTQVQTTKLGVGKYSIKITNLDATNSVTTVTATSATVDAVS